MQQTPKFFPTAYQNLAADIIARVRDDRNTIVGSLYTQEKRGVSNLYVKSNIGAKRVSRFVGSETATETASKRHDIETATARARARRKDLSVLRKVGLLMTPMTSGRVIDALSQFGLFNNGGVLIGTIAYQAYQLTLGAALPSTMLATDDADLAAAHLALEADMSPFAEGDRHNTNKQTDMLSILRHADSNFEAIPELDTRAPSSRFRSANGYSVDIVTPQRSRDDKQPLSLPHLNAGATGLQYLAWLIDGAIPAALPYGSGIFVTVPDPTRFAIHKLILSEARTHDATKAIKDRMQARALIEALQETSAGQLADAVVDACEQGNRGWKIPLKRAVKAAWPEGDWDSIEAFELIPVT